MQSVSMEKGLNSSEQISQDFRHCLFFARSRRIWRPRTSSQKTSRTGSSSCQYSMTLCGKRMMRIVSITLKRSRITRRDSNQYNGHFWVHCRKRDGMAILTIKKDNGIAQPTKWYSDSKKLAILSSKYHSLQWRFNGCGTLVPKSSFCQSAQCLRNSCEFVSSVRIDRRSKRTSRDCCGQ